MLGCLEELLRLQGSLELLSCRSGLRSCWLRSLARLGGCRACSCVEEHPDGCQAHEHVLDVLVVLVLGNNLLSKVHLFFNESLLVFPVRVVVVPVH